MPHLWSGDSVWVSVLSFYLVEVGAVYSLADLRASWRFSSCLIVEGLELHMDPAVCGYFMWVLGLSSKQFSSPRYLSGPSHIF